jgi:hypothetical protein
VKQLVSPADGRYSRNYIAQVRTSRNLRAGTRTGECPTWDARMVTSAVSSTSQRARCCIVILTRSRDAVLTLVGQKYRTFDLRFSSSIQQIGGLAPCEPQQNTQTSIGLTNRTIPRTVLYAHSDRFGSLTLLPASASTLMKGLIRSSETSPSLQPQNLTLHCMVLLRGLWGVRCSVNG